MAVLNIVITKAKQTIQVNTDGPDEGGDLPAEIYEAALAEGLKVLLNKGMSKITVKDLEGTKLTDAQEAAMEVAQKNLTNLRSGKLKGPCGKRQVRRQDPCRCHERGPTPCENPYQGHSQGRWQEARGIPAGSGDHRFRQYPP